MAMHVKHMVLGAAALLVLLLVLGVPLATALPYALVLACPLMMLFMMRAMHGGHGAGSGHDVSGHEEHANEDTDAKERVP